MSATIIPLTPEHNDITPEEIMQMETFKHLNEEEAREVLQFFDSFCGILYSFWCKQQPKQQSKAIPFQPIPQQKAA